MSDYIGYNPQHPETWMPDPPEIDEADVTLALAAKAGDVAGSDGATYAAEFLAGLDAERLNAFALLLYVSNQSFRDAFAAAYGESVREQLNRRAA